MSKGASLQWPLVVLVGLMGYAYKKLEHQPQGPAMRVATASEAGVSCRVVSENRVVSESHGVQCELEASVEVQVHTRYVVEPPPKYVTEQIASSCVTLLRNSTVVATVALT